jgi:phage repressor protein C with HTH and peptisase S24 domain
MDVIDGLVAAAAAKGLSTKEIAQAASLSYSQVTRLLSRKTKALDLRHVEAVAEVLGVSMAALYAGEDAAAKQQAQETRAALQTISAFIDRHDPTGLEHSGAASARKRRPAYRARPFPVAATPNVELDEGDKLPPVDVPPPLAKRGARFAARAIGDSMIGAGVENGDFVFFRSANSEEEARGKVVICRVNTAVYLKRLKWTKDEVRLESENEGYKPILIREGDEFELYGIVVLPA